jgi:two-component system NtrC family sensor kinase
MHFHTIRYKLIISLVVISFFIGLLSLLVGGKMLYGSLIEEANQRVRQDLNVARTIYEERIWSVQQAFEFIMSEHVQDLSLTENKELTSALENVSNMLQLDFYGITDLGGNEVFTYPAPKNEPIKVNPLVQSAQASQQAVSGTILLKGDHPAAKAPANKEKATSGSLSTAMAVGAAVPVVLNGRTAGFLYGGLVLNNDRIIVDKIGTTVFKNEIYKDRNVGTATIFHEDIRIATNVLGADGKRAIGTRASPQVTQKVLLEGNKWIDFAVVLNDRYLAAYEPITDISDQRVGMLYVGVLEEKYADVRKNAITVFSAITAAAVFIAILLGWVITNKIMQPVSKLIVASKAVSKGNFHPDIGAVSKDDIGMLQIKFLEMAGALKEREERQKIESETRLMQSEKQASLGKLAAGVAHEVNNPLTAVLTFTHLILRRNDLPAEVRPDLETIAAQTERVRRIVKSLLDFSRQSELTLQAVDMNALIAESVKLLENQAQMKGVALSFQSDSDSAVVQVDHNQCQSVMINMIINALDATPAGGKIDIKTQKEKTDGNQGVIIRVTDSGSGIPPEHMDKLFDPFFTTKPTGKGTGLGLAVSAGVIQRHNGTINVKSRLNQGTCFTIWLPCDQPAGTEGPTPQE